MKGWQGLLLLTLLLLGSVACSQYGNTAEPPQIIYGQDVCDRCNMIISEEKYAAAYWTEAGEARRFDDIGGMMAYLYDKPEAVASYWVHDFASGAWLAAEGATFVLAEDLMTPMGFGIVAFAEEAQALDMVHQRENVRVVSFAQLLDMQISMPASEMQEMSAHDEH